MPVLHTKTNRMWLPDALRGLALLNMLVYHGMYDWVYVFGHASRWYDIWARGAMRGSNISVGALLCCRVQLSAGPQAGQKRPAGGRCAAVLTVVTAVFMPSEAIWFGVLHLLRCAALLTCLLHPALATLPPLAGVTGSCGAVCPAESSCRRAG